MITDAIRNKARELIQGNRAQVVIGYAEGARGNIYPYIVRTPEETDRLIYSDACRHNLAVYLMKKEVRDLGIMAVVAHRDTMRAILQLIQEFQIAEGSVIVLDVTADGTVAEITDAKTLAERIARVPAPPNETDAALLKKIEEMSSEERWQFWMKEFSKCIKCYACRAACPMCYCTRCTVECNQPQWIHVPSHELGNLEWHVMRAMHLAGRCVNCGACYRACPLSIPLHILTIKLAKEIEEKMGTPAGSPHESPYALATFKPDDKENFIR